MQRRLPPLRLLGRRPTAHGRSLPLQRRLLRHLEPSCRGRSAAASATASTADPIRLWQPPGGVRGPVCLRELCDSCLLAHRSLRARRHQLLVHAGGAYPGPTFSGATLTLTAASGVTGSSTVTATQDRIAYIPERLLRLAFTVAASPSSLPKPLTRLFVQVGVIDDDRLLPSPAGGGVFAADRVAAPVRLSKRCCLSWVGGRCRGAGAFGGPGRDGTRAGRCSCAGKACCGWGGSVTAR